MKNYFLTVVYAIDDKPETVEAILAQRPWQAVAHTDALKDMEHAQADLDATIDGYAAARLEIASLKVRAADARHDIDDLTERDEIQRLRIAELEAQLAAIGAGGVEPLRKRECLHQICETAAPASDGAYPKLHERAAFEDWIKKDGGDLRMFGSGQNSHYCNSAVNNAWGGWKASAARVAAKASAPVVLPAPDAVLRFERSTAGKENEMPGVVSCNWLPDGEYKLYTEQQVRDLLATVGQALEAYPIDADVQQDSERLRGLHQMTTQSDTAASEAYQEAMEIEAKKVYDALNGRLELSTMQHYRQILDAGLNAASAAQGGV